MTQERNPIDRSSATWQFIEFSLTRRLAKLRARNDNPKLSVEETAAVRGEIAAVKHLLALPTAPADTLDAPDA